MRYQNFTIRSVHLFLYFLLAASCSMFLFNLNNGSMTFPVFATEIAGLKASLALRFDSLSTLMWIMISILGVSISHFAVYYLAGDARQSYFFRYLLLVVVSVSFLVLSSNLLMFYLAWLSTSYGLHKLLLYYPDRPAALESARKKYIVSRIGDLSLFVAFILMYQTFGTFEFAEIFTAVSAEALQLKDNLPVSLIGFFLVLGAITKSAQFPFHFWLPETMETPTPVSALMHAGVINAGGFLLIRLSPLLQFATGAHLLLILIGTITAVFGALCMITQNNIKKKLAYSTISQMGIMFFAIGMGAYGIALFHLVAHSFYKAYAFLNTGELVDESKKISLKLQGWSAPVFVSACLFNAALLLGGMFWQEGTYLAYFAYATIMVFGLAQSYGTTEGVTTSVFSIYAKVLGILGLGCGAYLVIKDGMLFFLAGLVPTVTEASHWNAPELVTLWVSFILFSVGFWLSTRLAQPNSPLLKKIYFYCWNGGYHEQIGSTILRKIYPQH